MIQSEREFVFQHQSGNLLGVMAMSSRENPDAFNEYLLQQFREQYAGRCYAGAYIRGVNRIVQRSMMSVGDFTREGIELASVAAKVSADVVLAEQGGVLCCSIQEINQANSNTMKLVVCRGLGDMDMVRVYMTIENTQIERFQFATGQVILVIIQQALYRDNAIHVIGHPFVPVTGEQVYQLLGGEQTPEVRGLCARIQISRTRINSAPQATRDAVLSLLTGIKHTRDRSASNIEQSDLTKARIIGLDAISLFTGTLVDTDIQSSDPRIVKPQQRRVDIDNYLTVILHKVYSYIRAFEQILNSIKSPRDLQMLELYIESAYLATQHQQ